MVLIVAPVVLICSRLKPSKKDLLDIGSWASLRGSGAKSSLSAAIGPRAAAIDFWMNSRRLDLGIVTPVPGCAFFQAARWHAPLIFARTVAVYTSPIAHRAFSYPQGFECRIRRNRMPDIPEPCNVWQLFSGSLRVSPGKALLADAGLAGNPRRI